jgi:peptidoglycan hydrolase-like protein with peptidoglycan-binding domain
MGLVLVAIVVVVLVNDPFRGAGKSDGVADNATATSLVTVTRRSLASQTQISATLGYADSSSIRIPAGTPPSAVQQAQQSIASSEGRLRRARASLANDSETLAELHAARSTAQEQRGAALKVEGDREAVASAATALAGAEANLSAARSSAAAYSQSSIFTMLPAVGHVVRRGQSLYQLSGQPVVLLYGSVLPTRAFIAGMSAGSDVAELNANLDALGYAAGLAGDTFSAATAAAIQAFQSAHGLTPTGELPLGSVVFEPGPVRVTSVTPTVGASVQPGPVLGITSTTPQVTIALGAAEQSSVKVGYPVTITLPNNQTTPGVVRSVGTVAKAPSSGKGGEGGGGGGGGGEGGEEDQPTIEVDVAPADPRAIGHLDEAPVTVSITTASVPSTLVVPVDALLALAGGGYAVEVVEGRVHRLVAVTPGLFDDAEGLVQVSGQGLTAGQRVVVPAT